MKIETAKALKAQFREPLDRIITIFAAAAAGLAQPIGQEETGKLIHRANGLITAYSAVVEAVAFAEAKGITPREGQEALEQEAKREYLKLAIEQGFIPEGTSVEDPSVGRTLQALLAFRMLTTDNVVPATVDLELDGMPDAGGIDGPLLALYVRVNAEAQANYDAQKEREKELQPQGEGRTRAQEVRERLAKLLQEEEDTELQPVS